MITGAEALLRWTLPGRGPIPPVQFIPVAEDCGLILPIGNWVLREFPVDAIKIDQSFVREFASLLATGIPAAARMARGAQRGAPAKAPAQPSITG